MIYSNISIVILLAFLSMAVGTCIVLGDANPLSDLLSLGIAGGNSQLLAMYNDWSYSVAQTRVKTTY